MEFDDLSKKVIGHAIEVHKELGPGLLESIYKKCLVYELTQAGIEVQVEKEVPIIYKGVNMNCCQRVDIVVENCMILELKSVAHLLPVHESQLLGYMRLAKIKIGLLINFHKNLLRNGIKRFVL